MHSALTRDQPEIGLCCFGEEVHGERSRQRRKDGDKLDCQDCLSKSVGGQVEEGAVHSRMEGNDYAAAGIGGGSEKSEQGVVTQAIDMGTPLGCRDRKKKALYPWSLDAGDSHLASAAQNLGRKL